MEFSLYHADVVGNPTNCSYPHLITVIDEDSLKEAVSYDYVCAAYKNNYRSNDHFLYADCLPVECDNDHSENPDEWITPEDVAAAFPDVAFAVHFSRNHMLAKGSRAPRPKFHLFFPIARITDASLYSELKHQIARLFPYFDTKALDAARFFFGTPDASVAFFEGALTIDDYLLGADFDSDLPQFDEIPEGSRNATLSRFAGRILKRYGNTDIAKQAFLDKAATCTPPLDKEELRSIWTSAKRFYAKIQTSPDYIAPDAYNDENSYVPDDFSDVGQAEVLMRYFSSELRYSPATRYLRYLEHFWQESEEGAQAVAHELTRRQLKESRTMMAQALMRLEATGANQLMAQMSQKKAESAMTDDQAEAFELYTRAKTYQTFAIKRRDSKNITATLKEARPMLEVSVKDLDADAFLLNTPSAMYDLRRGISGALPHDPTRFCTKITGCAPSDIGASLWQEFLGTIFCGDVDLIGYVQRICGLAAIGKVMLEALIIAYGDGRNGKSTFWNTISRCLGTYAGNMSADTLTVGCKRNVKPELAEAKGKRLLIAAEMEEGMRFNTSNVKQLCSTDEIYAEKKYKEPFSYTPSHTLVLYTNHLPKVGAIDSGTWRRLIVIPFSATIKEDSDIKNYADYLFEHASGAILSWIIEGARLVYSENFHLAQPEVVVQAIKAYRDNNDWIEHFLEECCELDPTYIEKSGAVYSAYRDFCVQTGEWTRSTTDFYTGLESSGFERKRLKTGRFIKGLKLKSDFLD
ncbi:phage/plasmid primase, P4 family [Alloscardovia omnicolens]|uniref:phage/plasmid primase, P4 family n=1 Tax=Alloscardovia omnicolens TaxID=419015 RepID=UPI003A774618